MTVSSWDSEGTGNQWVLPQCSDWGELVLPQSQPCCFRAPLNLQGLAPEWSWLVCRDDFGFTLEWNLPRASISTPGACPVKRTLLWSTRMLFLLLPPFLSLHGSPTAKPEGFGTLLYSADIYLFFTAASGHVKLCTVWI